MCKGETLTAQMTGCPQHSKTEADSMQVLRNDPWRVVDAQGVKVAR